VAPAELGADRVPQELRPTTSAAIAYDGRQISFTPGVSMSAMKTTENPLVLMGWWSEER
jgi:hypothetical protein